MHGLNGRGEYKTNRVAKVKDSLYGDNSKKQEGILSTTASGLSGGGEGHLKFSGYRLHRAVKHLC